jgi:flagellum-specific ATP synthase
MHNITSPAHQQQARKLKQLYARYQRSRDLISVGAYAPGSDPLLDQAISLHDKIDAFLCQEIVEKVGMLESLGQLTSLFD